MNTLYFVKMVNTKGVDQIVYCLTAKNEAEAIAKGLLGIDARWRDDYSRVTAEAVCKTRDTVNYFEPV
jgi:uncharacterized ferredoxin-like protein